eukprot:COSAG02_NODE_40593_length_403_cov_4.506579_1_plen_59_part_00
MIIISGLWVSGALKSVVMLGTKVSVSNRDLQCALVVGAVCALLALLAGDADHCRGALA